MAALTKKILKATTSEEAKKIFESVKGSVLQSKLKKKLIESSTLSSEAFNTLTIDPLTLNPLTIDPKLSFLQAQVKAPVYTQPNPSKYLTPRLAKWQLISDNLAKMDDGILREYRERRREGKGKEKKNKYPF